MNDPDSRDLSALLTRLRTLQPGSPEREAYLDDLARRVRSGEYQPDARQIASRLMDEALGRKPPDDEGSPECE
jgi:hypothetical protein